MKIEIRSASDTEMDEYRRVARTALMIAPDLLPADAMQAVRPDMTLCAFVDGNLATAYAWWPLKMFITGQIVPVAGITFVGTLPVYRRHGLLRHVIQNHLKWLHTYDGQPLTVLYASQAAIYHRFGYAVVSTRNAYEVAPQHIRFLNFNHQTKPVGALREIGDHEFEILNQLYLAFCQERTGYLVRGKGWWAAGPLQTPKKDEVLCKIVYEENAKPLGYVIYTIAGRNVSRGQPWQQVNIRDLAWFTPSAYRALWEHFASMDLAISINTLFTPVDDPLPHLLLEPRRLNISTMDGLLARIVDVQKLIALKSFTEEGQVIFEIKDDLCPWNAGIWQLVASSGAATLERSTQSAQAIIPIDTLAMLLFGQISPLEALRMGRMEICDKGVLTIWDRLMRTPYKPFCPDFF